MRGCTYQRVEIEGQELFLVERRGAKVAAFREEAAARALVDVMERAVVVWSTRCVHPKASSVDHGSDATEQGRPDLPVHAGVERSASFAYSRGLQPPADGAFTVVAAQGGRIASFDDERDTRRCVLLLQEAQIVWCTYTG